MNINIDWGILNINVPRTEMLLVQSTPVEIRQLDLTEFRFAMHDKQDDEAGMSYKHMHERVPPKTVAGVTLAQVIEIVNNYTVTFEDGLYNVNIVGGNSNVADKVIKNQVGVNTANSAGLQDSTSLQAASFGGVVTIDVINGVTGTVFPIGTKGTPSNNIQDIKTILDKQNMNTIEIIGSLTLDTGDDVSNLIIQGTNPMTSLLHVEPGAITDNLYVKELYFDGTLDGGSILRDCVLGTIHYFNGYIEHCALTSNTLYVNGLGVLLNCSAGATCISAPIIDLTNVNGLAIREYNGNLLIKEKHNSSICQIGMNGLLEIDPTVDTGGIIVYGDVDVVDNSTGTFIVDDRSTGAPSEIANAVWIESNRTLTEGGSGGLDEEELHLALDNYANKNDWKADIGYLNKSVYIDTDALFNGDGSQGSPYDNVNDAKDHAENTGIKNIFASGDIIVPGNLKGMNVYGIGIPKIDLNGKNIKNSRFYEAELSGTYTDALIAQECHLMNGMLLGGHFLTCELLGTLTASSTAGEVTLVNCFSGIHNGEVILSMNPGFETKVLVSGYKGNIKITNTDNANDKLTLIMDGGVVTLDPTCTLGNIEIDGHCIIINNSNGTIITDNRLPTALQTAEEVWEYNIPDLVDPGLYSPLFPQGRI